MKKTMQIFAAVGPLGSGKTSLILNTIRALESRGFPTRSKIAYVVNDAGGMVDGELAGGSVEVIAMTNGCFTCFDTADLKKVLSRLEGSGIMWVFLEGFGLTAGNDTRQFLESCDYGFHVLCLLSARHLSQDRVIYADVVKSQARAATCAIGVTKCYGNSVFDSDALGNVPEFAAKENPGIPLVVIPNDASIPALILDLFEKGEQSMSLHRHEHHGNCNSGCGHGCCHHRHHRHHDHAGETDEVHGMRPYFHELKPGVRLSDLRRVFDGKDSLLRIKGAVEGRVFNWIHGEWEQGAADSRRYVTFYSSRRIDIDSDLPGLTDLIIVSAAADSGADANAAASMNDQRPSYEQIRAETATRDETVAAIGYLLTKIPARPIVLNTAGGIRIITHPEELQTVKEISRRPYVKEEWFAPVLKCCMEYWIACAEVVRDRSNEIVPQDIAKNRYELGVSMVWWTNRFGDFFGPDIVMRVKSLRPGMMVAEGIRTIESLIVPSVSDGISWQCAEFTDALSFGLRDGDDADAILAAARHCLALTDPSSALEGQWRESLDRLEKEARSSA